jgi:hypothetical protein
MQVLQLRSAELQGEQGGAKAAVYTLIYKGEVRIKDWQYILAGE